MRNFKNINRVVVKVGTTSLTFENGKLNFSRIDKLARTLTSIHNQGVDVILVTSGAVAVGKDRLGILERDVTLAEKQASSAIGQNSLMEIYSKFFHEYNQNVAQILLTKDVIDNKVRRENTINTFETLLKFGVIPIVNENDTVSTDEIEFSDNDSLSALVSTIIESDLLVILSDIEGLFDKDPKIYSDAKIIREVDNINDDIKKLGGKSQSGLGTGGMYTKILASEVCSKNNIKTVIAKGEDPSIIERILKGEEIGTYFKSKQEV